MANSFCTNCGAPLKPNAKFCGHCGAKLVSSDEQPTANNTVDSNPANSQNSNTVNTVKQKAAAIVNEDTLNNVKQKASTLLNEKNLNDVKEKASTFIHEANVNDLKEQATANVQKLPNWLKIVAVVLIVALVGYGGYYYFSPERQVTKATEHFIDSTFVLLTKDIKDISDSDIEKFAACFPPDKQEQWENALKDSFSRKSNQKAFMTEKPSYKITKIVMQDDTHAAVSVITDVDEASSQIFGITPSSTIYFQKIDGSWYIYRLR